MRSRIKRIIPIVALLLLCTTLLAGMSGCFGKDSNRFDTDLFSCMYNEDKTGVIILELTEKGQEQEILVIPEEINGLPVVQLGGDTKGYPYMIGHKLQSEKVRKIYCLIKDRKLNSIYSNFKCTQRVDIVLYADSVASFCLNGDTCNNHFFSLINDETATEGRYILERSNVHFYLNSKSENAIYWFDVINGNDYYVLPTEPIRDGYIFSGWYLNKECTIPWDGKFVLPEGENELNLYAKWIKK